MCDQCILWCDVTIKVQASTLNPNRPQAYPPCKFHCYRRSHRYACGIQRGVQISSSNKQPSKESRRCLASEGAVQLCEHKHVSWPAIEAHITDWQQRRPGDWQACFNHFDFECHDPSHDTRCSAGQASTGPRARLQTATYDRNRVVLNLEWSPHSGLDAFALTPDGRAPASELRELFRSCRQGPADILLPSYPSNPLPEMTYFSPTECRCIHYETGDTIKGPSAPYPSGHAGFFRDDRPYRCPSHHFYYRLHGYGKNGERVDMSAHWPRGTRNSVCLVTTYQRDILVCFKIDRSKIRPTHEWLHAMDPDTYSCPPADDALPLCKNLD